MKIDLLNKLDKSLEYIQQHKERSLPFHDNATSDNYDSDNADDSAKRDKKQPQITKLDEEYSRDAIIERLMSTARRQVKMFSPCLAHYEWEVTDPITQIAVKARVTPEKLELPNLKQVDKFCSIGTRNKDWDVS